MLHLDKDKTELTFSHATLKLIRVSHSHTVTYLRSLNNPYSAAQMPLYSLQDALPADVLAHRDFWSFR